MEQLLSCGSLCYDAEQNVITWDQMLLSRANVIMWSECYHVEAYVILWDEMISCGTKSYRLEQMLCGKCYHMETYVMM